MKQIRCNKCGKIIPERNDILLEDVFEGKKEWGYFSQKDLQVETFYLCEACYERMTKDFVIPVKVEHKKEVL